ncbi:MAG: glycosyltransferase family 4 protein [Elusimicrobiota bacterium]
MGSKTGKKMLVKKIVHTITKLEFGGAQQNTLYTLNHLPEEYDGYLVCGTGGYLDSQAENPERFKIKFCSFLRREISPLSDWKAYKWMVDYFKKIQPDILHSHSSKAGIISRWAAKRAGVPVIIHTFHGFGFTPLQPWFVRKFFIWLEKKTAKISTKLIFVSHANRKTAEELGIGVKEQYEVVRSGIEIQQFGPKESHEYLKRRCEKIGLKDGHKIVGNVSCFKPQKSLHDYIEACRRLKEKGADDYRFVLIGEGELRNQLEKQSEEAGLTGLFDMQPGWSEDIQQIIPEFDVMLHTARFEGLPRVLLEAMASGIPVVATDVDGARDVIEHGVNGYLVDPGDIDAMVKYTHELLQDDDKRKKMGEAGRKKLYPENTEPAFTKSEFDIGEMSKTLNNLYNRLLSGTKE